MPGKSTVAQPAGPRADRSPPPLAQQDEINILRVAADAIANTFVREDLLTQLRANLDETESLYNASNRLVVANDFQEMLAPR